MDKFKGYYGDCKWKEFENNIPVELKRLFANDSCGQYASNKVCTEKCVRDSRLYLSNVCLQGDLGEFLVGRTRTKNYFKMLQQCAMSKLVITESSDDANVGPVFTISALALCFSLTIFGLINCV